MTSTSMTMRTVRRCVTHALSGCYAEAATDWVAVVLPERSATAQLLGRSQALPLSLQSCMYAAWFTMQKLQIYAAALPGCTWGWATVPRTAGSAACLSRAQLMILHSALIAPTSLQTAILLSCCPAGGRH